MAATTDTDDLIARVQDLSPELFNDIRDLVFTPDSTEVHIDHNYKPPKFLQISCATREQFAALYYAGTTFILETTSDQNAVVHMAMLLDFLDSIPKLHCLSIKSIHIFRAKNWTSVSPQVEAERTRGLLKNVSGVRQAFGAVSLDLKLSEDLMISTNVSVKDEETGAKMQLAAKCRYGD